MECGVDVRLRRDYIRLRPAAWRRRSSSPHPPERVIPSDRRESRDLTAESQHYAAGFQISPLAALGRDDTSGERKIFQRKNPGGDVPLYGFAGAFPWSGAVAAGRPQGSPLRCESGGLPCRGGACAPPALHIPQGEADPIRAEGAPSLHTPDSTLHTERQQRTIGPLLPFSIPSKPDPWRRG